MINPTLTLIERMQQGRLHDPFELLGPHPQPVGWQIRAWSPTATEVKLQGLHRMRRIEDTACFVVDLTEKQYQALPKHYRLDWLEADGSTHSMVSPYSFEPLLGELDLHLFAEGHHWQIYQHMGAILKQVDGIEGVQFAVWAPSAERVSVVGDFNGWHGLRHPMRCRGSSGVWELFIPGLQPGDNYKFEIRNNQTGSVFTKTDPYAKSMELRPHTASIITDTHYEWHDQAWLKQREDDDWAHKPINIYEVHLGSWQKDDQGNFLNYREIAHRMVEYVKWMGYTHIELLPITEHPFDGSWGYQTSGYYSPTRRFGSPDDFRYFVDHCHQNGIGVFLDWVPAHFPKDSFALARFDGSALYEHEDPRLGEHKDWGTYIFNFGRNEVRNFLIANALYWLKEFHLDGLRVDAVASMLYLDYSRNAGEWIPNIHGGRENLEAIAFMQQLNAEVHSQHPGTLVMAEESTSWPMVSRPTWMGGLGFSMKWNMGWMNDTLDYFEKDTIYRPYHHNQLTFSQIYAYSENFVMPLSHDEVVHMKGSLVNKMPGDTWQKMANFRLLMGYQLLNPGKKLLFMGCEFAPWNEWNEAEALPWHYVDQPMHRGAQLLVRDMNQLYKAQAALHQYDFDSKGFSWIDCHDHAQSILSFERHSDDETLVCVFNFTPVPRYGYRIGLPETGCYQEIVNSDSELYGGSNLGNAGQLHSEPQPWMNRPVSVEMTLPPLGFLVLKKV
ncbi:1,4-alpha-glucan branching protein GlgB [Thiomicrospira microaerophila]|uniref:1,4-alpha-glucan branching protein GlgB n=1 Tax=Thiomicrospira microaerophila TaxID=406020 RepID=UPI00200C1128|nr:1,4-alpha-glucan branching protein GlgB [Thiomicrospira microaerophila]UQB41582.1 1,4-alpha-glucan branching protein GlgB [Thiomicrospira microaerophila]